MRRIALLLVLAGCTGTPESTQPVESFRPHQNQPILLPRTFSIFEANKTVRVLSDRLGLLGATQDQPPTALEIHVDGTSNAPRTLSVGTVPMGPPAWIGVRETNSGPAFRVLYAPNGLDAAERTILEGVLLRLMQETKKGSPEGDPKS